MRALVKLCVLLLCVGVVSSLGFAQTSASKPSDKPSSQGRKSSGADISSVEDEIGRFRRVTAIALITDLAEEAREYRDENLRVRIQARAAEALWSSDQRRALSLFHRAWETAEVIDTESQQRNEEDRKAFLSGQSQIGFIPPPKNLRLEVLRFAARCDRELADKLLAKLEEEKKNDGDTPSKAGTIEHWDPTKPPLAIDKRLQLANLLLDAGEVEKALRVADPALERVTKPSIVFLYKLRQINPTAADQRFSALLMRTAVDPVADANSISLLSTYAFTPLIFATVTRNGRVYGGDPGPVPDLSGDVHASFFRVAAQVLLRPTPPPGQDQSSAGREGTYFVIARLLPLFEKHAPEKVSELNSHLTALTQDTPETLRNDYRMRTVGFGSESPAIDDLELALKQAQRASGSGERDQIYLRSVNRLINTDPARAREVAEKIENLDLRSQALALVDFVVLRAAVKGQNKEAILRIVRSGTLPRIHKVWGYTEAAQLLKSDPIAALQTLGEAASEARRIDEKKVERVQALTAIATSFFDIDRARAWETIGEVVKASGHTEGFQGEAGRVTANLGTGTMVTMLRLDVPSFDLAGIFSSLAREDLQRAIDLARTFPATEPRAIAIFAIARSALEENNKGRLRNN